MKILLHSCCADCCPYICKRLKEENFKVTLFWYNPNIHPYTEYQKRLMSLGFFAQKVDLPVIYNDEYNLEGFLRGQIKALDKEELRCQFCYQLRLKETARVAKEKGFDCFTTTLLYSTHQKHNLIKEIAGDLGRVYKVKFYYEDFRGGFPEGIKLSKEMHLYRQNYCGCIFSEAERHLKKLKMKDKI